MKLENVTIVNYNHTIDNADIFIENGLISKIVKKSGQGTKVVLPGFIDAHIHGFNNQDVMDSKNAVAKISQGLILVGVTSFFPTIMTNTWDKIIKAIKHTAQTQVQGAKIAGIHLEGPFISQAKKGAHNPQYIIGATQDKIRELYDASLGTLQKITWAPEVNDIKLIDYMVSLGMVVSIGHSNASAQQAYQAFKHGITSATHLWNGMSGVVNRNQGVVTGVLQDQRVYAELICDLVHLDAETIRFSIKSKTPEKIILVSDAISPAGLKDGVYKSGGLDVQKQGTVIKLLDGQSIAGGAGSIDIGFKTLLQMNYDLEDIVKMTSYNVAQNQKLDKVGQIKVNYFADLIVFDKNTMNLENVYVNGIKKM